MFFKVAFEIFSYRVVLSGFWWNENEFRTHVTTTMYVPSTQWTVLLWFEESVELGLRHKVLR